MPHALGQSRTAWHSSQMHRAVRWQGYSAKARDRKAQDKRDKQDNSRWNWQSYGLVLSHLQPFLLVLLAACTACKNTHHRHSTRNVRVCHTQGQRGHNATQGDWIAPKQHCCMCCLTALRTIPASLFHVLTVHSCHAWECSGWQLT